MKPYELIDGGLYKVGDKVVKYGLWNGRLNGRDDICSLTCKKGEVLAVVYYGDDVPFDTISIPVEPLPLTAEFLEKNGFYDRNTQWYYKRYWSNGCFDIAVALDYREIEVSKVCGSGTDCEEVEYGSTIAFGSDINAHELQQALHICGLHDLANNLTWEE